MDSIGRRLKVERERLGLTQVEMATRTNTTRTSQQNYENDRNSPSADYLARVAALGVDVQYVVTGERGTRKADKA